MIDRGKDLTGGWKPTDSLGRIAEPVRFLALSVPRSGTMLINNVLQLHPAVRLHNFYSRDPSDRAPARNHYCWRLFQWQQPHPDVTHLGTVMHYVGSGWIEGFTYFNPSRFWPMLAHAHDRFVCLRRKNLLRQFLSRKVGVKLQSYDVHRTREQKGDPGPLELPLEELSNFVLAMESMVGSVNSFFPGRLTVLYEDLDADWKKTIFGICDYLELPWYDGFQVITKKQERRSLEAAISNYEEVKSWCYENNHEEWLA